MNIETFEEKLLDGADRCDKCLTKLEGFKKFTADTEFIVRVQKYRKWGLLSWCPKEALARNKPGRTYHYEHLIFESGELRVFSTRREARRYAKDRYGYIKNRPDLLNYPHFWRIPVPVKIKGIIFKKPDPHA